MTALSFFVSGVPVQQGNHRRNQHGATYETSRNHGPWRDSIIHAARQAWMCPPDEDYWLFPGPVRIELVFAYPRPKAHYRTGQHATQLRDTAPQWKTTAPDLDKLVRAALDAITIAGLWRDDAQAADLHAVKQYAHTPGLAVTIEDALQPAPVVPFVSRTGQLTRPVEDARPL